MTFEYVTIPPGIDADADIYPRRVGRQDERALYGIDPAFIVEAYVERSTALDLPGKGGRYVLGMPVGETLEGKDGGVGIGFLSCIEGIRTDGSGIYFKFWAKPGYSFEPKTGISAEEYGDIAKAYPGCAVDDWAQTPGQLDRAIRLERLKACYHDIARMSRVMAEGYVTHGAGTSTVVHKSIYSDPETITNEISEGDWFASPYGGTHGGGEYYEYYYKRQDTTEYEYGSASYTCKAFPVVFYRRKIPFKSAVALLKVYTYEDDGNGTEKRYYDIVVSDVGEDGSVSFGGETARTVALGHKSIPPVDGRQYQLRTSLESVHVVASLDLRTLVTYD